MEIFDRYSFWIAKLALAKSGMVTLPSVILFLSVHNSVTGQTPLYSLLGDTAELPCASSSQDDTYIWSDESLTPALTIYLVNDGSDPEKSERARNEPKYDNFGIDNNYPDFVNMTMQSVEIEDEGLYQCTLFNAAADTVAYNVHVEALPLSPVSIVCTTSDVCSLSSDNSLEFTCTCSANGAYPEELHFEWNNNTIVGSTSVSDSSLTEREWAFDFTGVAKIAPTVDQDKLTCTLVGYNSTNLPETDRRASYQFVPPTCTVTIDPKSNCESVDLICDCGDSAKPAVTKYQFYNGSRAPVSEEQSVNEIVGLRIMPNAENYTFGCRACNGVANGNSYAMRTVSCIPSTTAKPTTTLTTEITSSTPDPNTTATVTTPTTSTGKKVNPTGTKGPPVGLIVGLSVGIPILIIILVLAIWFFKNRGGGHTKHTSDPPQSDDPVIAMNASTTSSLAPLYQDVKKEKKKKSDDSVSTSGDKETPVSKEMSPAVYAVPDKKKKSDKPDGNGAGPESSQPTYADVNKPTQPTAAPRTSQKVPDSQPMQELQYAELDHGKQPPTNEIRKPQGEPTEYATVQSVIV